MMSLDLRRGERGLPRSLLNDVWGMFDDLDSSFFVPIARRGTAERSMSPFCDVSESEDSFMVSVDIPGLKRDDINIEVVGRQLVISGERKREEETSSGGARRIERSYGKFQRAFDLPERINLEKIEASYEDGVLNVTLPKTEAVKPRKIQIAEGGKGLFKRIIGEKEAKAIHS